MAGRKGAPPSLKDKATAGSRYRHSPDPLLCPMPRQPGTGLHSVRQQEWEVPPTASHRGLSTWRRAAPAPPPLCKQPAVRLGSPLPSLLSAGSLPDPGPPPPLTPGRDASPSPQPCWRLLPLLRFLKGVQAPTGLSLLFHFQSQGHVSKHQASKLRGHGPTQPAWPSPRCGRGVNRTPDSHGAHRTQSPWGSEEEGSPCRRQGGA